MLKTLIQKSNLYRIKITTLNYFILYMIVCLCWGTTWIGIKFATLTIPPLTSAGLRFVIAFPFFIIISHMVKEPVFYPRGCHKLFWLITILYFSLPYFLICYAETTVSSGMTSLVFSTMPVFIIIFSALFNGGKCNIHQLLGIVVGIVSLFFILLTQEVAITSSNNLGIIAVSLAAAMHGLCYVLTKKYGLTISVVTFNTLPIGVAGIGMTIMGIIFEDNDISQISIQSILGLLYLGIIASIGGFLAYFYLLKRINSTLLSYVFVIFPVIAIYIGSTFNQEEINNSFIYLVIIMLIGISYTKYHTPDDD